MKRVTIDFAPSSLAVGLMRLSPLGWLSGIGALATLIWCAAQLWRIEVERNVVAVAQQSAELHSRRLATIKVAKRIAIPGPQVDAVNQAVSQLNLPWRDLFDAIETSTPANVALLSLEPNARRHVLHGIAEAPNSGAMMEYLRGLRSQSFFTDAVLTRHEINDKDPNHPIRFQFDVHWKVN